MQNRIICIILLLAAVGLAGCAAKPALDVRGDWAYVMTAAGGNTYDEGTITFSSAADKGAYLQRNFYNVEYSGEFTLDGANLKLSGAETWQGTLTAVQTPCKVPGSTTANRALSPPNENK